MNTLYFGDNLDILRQHVADASVDLVYLDPPFQSGADYDVLFEARSGGGERARAEAFKDTWKWGPEAEATYADIERAGGEIGRSIRALRSILGESDIMAYLCMMGPRLVELRRVLKRTGSLYLHCDPTASHYLKVLLDGVFGPGCFRNEVIWRYRRWPTKAHRFQRMHDVLLYYTANAGNGHTFHTLYGYEKLADSTLKAFGTKKQRADFSSGHRKPSVEEVETAGPPLSDVWEVGIIAPVGRERTGYPTQKPEALLERIVLASSQEGDVVLDPFCGCGTTIAVAERLGRRWVGIDITHLAVDIIRERMAGSSFEVRGEPSDVQGAEELARRDPYRFRCWMLGRTGARPSDRKRRGGANADGELFFHDAPHGVADERALISVKDSPCQPDDVRELLGMVAREGAALGALLTLHEPTRAVIAEAADAGFYDSHSGRHPRVQILTAAQILDGRGLDYPGSNVTRVKWARRAPPQTQMPLLGLASPGLPPTRRGKKREG